MALSQKRAAAAPSTPSLAAVSSTAPPSEQPTIVGSPYSGNNEDDAVSLVLRAPDVADVLKSISTDHTSVQHFASGDGFITISDKDMFFQGEGMVMWGEVGRHLLDAIKLSGKSGKSTDNDADCRRLQSNGSSVIPDALKIRRRKISGNN